MARQLFRFVDGEFKEVSGSESAPVDAPFVHDDTLKAPIRDMTFRERDEDGNDTGKRKYYDSASTYRKDMAAKGYEILGNDLQSRSSDRRPEKITESIVLDKIQKAESILNDPSKFRARMNENMERLARRESLIRG